MGFSCRRHDLHLLFESNLNEMLTNLYVGDNPEDHYQIYGDSAYIIIQNITCGHECVPGKHRVDVSRFKGYVGDYLNYIQVKITQ